MNTAKNTVTADAELIDILTAISTVSMRLAVKLEMLAGKKRPCSPNENRKNSVGGKRHEIV